MGLDEDGDGMDEEVYLWMISLVDDGIKKEVVIILFENFKNGELDYGYEMIFVN